MNRYKEILGRFHNDAVIDAAENYAGNAFNFDPMILRMFAHKICEYAGTNYSDEMKKVVDMTCDDINDWAKLNYMHGFVYGVEHAVNNHFTSADIERVVDKNCEFTMNRDFAFIFNFGDNDFSGYVEDVAKMYCEKYNEVMWQIEEYTKFNVSMDSYVEQIEKYESWRVIKELYKSLFNHVKSYYTVRDLKYNNTEFDISKLIEENNKHIKYLGFDDPNKYVFGTNEQITKILDDGYKYEPENENTFYWDNAETLVVRVKNGRMTCKII
jgi:hypothetical protein